MREFQPISSTDLSAIGQRCPECRESRMILSKVESGPAGFVYRTFECQRCGRIQTSMASSDPVKSGAPMKLDSEFVPPTLRSRIVKQEPCDDRIFAGINFA